jgi:hypothetical protein
MKVVVLVARDRESQMNASGKIRRILRTGTFWVAVAVGTLGGLAYGIARHETTRGVASHSLDGMAFGLVSLSTVEGFRSKGWKIKTPKQPPSP